MRTYTAWLSAFATLFTITFTAHAQLTITDVGRYDFTDTSGSGAREISGLARIWGTGGIYAIGDKDALLHSLSIGLNSTTGQITSAAFSPTPLALGSSSAGDREAVWSLGSSLLIANENGPKLEAFDHTGVLQGEPATSTVPGFEIYANSRPNRAWESLTAFSSSDQRPVLMANEDALTVDGPAASFTAGATVRIQSAHVNTTNSTSSAIGQFAYPIDAINGDNPFVTGETSGLVELIALENDQVLAMERAVGLSGYRIRIYLIDGDSATDVSIHPGLAGLTPGVDYTPLGKTLLWENTFSALSNSNFEGLTYHALNLADGRRSLILIADNASGPVLPVVGQQWTTNDHSLYALTIGDNNPACAGPSGCLTADLDEDGFVGIADLNLILSRWNQIVFPGSASDPSVDGFVGIDDLNVVLGNWNAGTPPTGLATIPEPASAAILGWLSIVLAKRTPAGAAR